MPTHRYTVPLSMTLWILRSPPVVIAIRDSSSRVMVFFMLPPFFE